MKKILTLLCLTIWSYAGKAQCSCDSLAIEVRDPLHAYKIFAGQNAQLIFRLTNNSVNAIHSLFVNLGHNSNFYLYGYQLNSIDSIDGSCSCLLPLNDTVLVLDSINILSGNSAFLHICFRASCTSDSSANLDLPFIFTYGCDSTVSCSASIPIPPNFSIAGGGTPHLSDTAVTNAMLTGYGLPWVLNSSNSHCSAVGDTATMGIKYTSTGGTTSEQPGLKNVLKIKCYFETYDEFGTIDSTSFKILRTTDNTLVSIPDGLSTVYNGVGVKYYEIDFTKLVMIGSDSIPFGSNTLKDLDHDSIVDDLAEGKNFMLFFTYKYQNGCPITFNSVNISKHFLIKNIEKFNNQCNTLDSVFTIDSLHATKFKLTDFERDDFYGVQFDYTASELTPATLSAPADVDVNVNPQIKIHLCPEFAEILRPDNFYFKCDSGYYLTRIVLPPGFHLDKQYIHDTLTGFYDSINIVTSVANACNGGPLDTLMSYISEDTATSCANPGVVTIKIIPRSACIPYHNFSIPCFDVPLFLNCDTSVCHVLNYPDSTSKFKDTVEYVCCPRCINKLTSASGITNTHCHGPCATSSPFSTTSPFIFNRTTLGWLNTNGALGYDCASIIPAATVPINSMIRLNRAYPGDAMEAKMQGDFTGDGAYYDSIYFRIKYNDLGINSGSHSIFDLDQFTLSTITVSGFSAGSGIPNPYIDTLSPSDFVPFYDSVSDEDKMKFHLRTSFIHDTLLIANRAGSAYHLTADIHLVVKSTNVHNPHIAPVSGCTTFFSGGRHPLINLREELMGEKDTTFYRSCDSWGANDTILQPSARFEFGGVATTCSQFNLPLTFYSTSALFSIHGGDDFPHEYRPYSKLNDNLMVIVPPGYQYLSADFATVLDGYSGVPGDNYFSSAGVHWSSVVLDTPLVAHDTLIFNGLNGNCFPLLDTKSFFNNPSQYRVTIHFQPDCDAPASTEFKVITGYTETIQHQDTAYTNYYTNKTTISQNKTVTHSPFTLSFTPVASTNMYTAGSTITGAFQICTPDSAVHFPFLIIVPHSSFFTGLTFLDSIRGWTSWHTLTLHHGMTQDTVVFDPVIMDSCVNFKVIGFYNGLACSTQLNASDSLFHANLFLDLNYGCTATGPQCLISHNTLNFLITPTIIDTIPNIIVSNDTICPGTVATLTASGAMSYWWSTTDTLNTISVSPISSATYTVIGSNHACRDTASATVKVRPKPDIKIIDIWKGCFPSPLTLIASGCSSYTWSAPIVSHSVLGDTAYYNITDTTTFTVVGIDSFGCLDTTRITIKGMPCEVSSTGDDRICLDDSRTGVNLGNRHGSLTLHVDSVSNIIPNLGTWATSSGGNVYVSSKQFSINGSFYVDGNLVIKDCDIKLGPLSEIVLMPKDTLTILGSYLRGCDTLWDGIKMSANNEKVIIRNSFIEDAIYAVNDLKGGRYDIDSTVFNKNHIGMLIDTYSGNMQPNMDYNVHHSIFTCRHIDSLYWSMPVNTIARTILNNYHVNNNVCTYSKDWIKIPHVMQRSFAGIKVQNITSATSFIQFGDTTFNYKDNVFDYMDYGIQVSTSNAAIYNNEFENCGHISKERDLSGTAIYAAQKGSNYKLIVGGLGTASSYLPNSIDTCTIGVYCKNYNADIIKNKFENINSEGVYIDASTNKTINIVVNNMKTMAGGVYANDFGSCTTTIADNTIRVDGVMGGYGIYTGDPMPVATGSLNIKNNRVDLEKGVIGIFMRGVHHGVIEADTVNFLSNSYPTASIWWGIKTEYSDKDTVRDNIVQQYNMVTPNSVMSKTLIGISVDRCVQSQVYKNNLIRMGSGIVGISSCNNSMLACNNLDTCYYGFKFTSANIGQQFPYGTAVPSGNVWTNITGSFGWITGTVTPTSYWYGDFPLFSNSGVIGDSILITSNLDSCNSYHVHEGGGSGEEREKKLGKIIRGENIYDSLGTEFKLRDSVYAYKTLKADTTLLTLGTTDDILYQKFYDSTKTKNIGSFQKVVAYVKDATQTDTTAAIITNQNIPTRCSIEENQKLVNSIYLNEIRHNADSLGNYEDRYKYDSSEIAQLQNVAYQNPIKGGDAVFMARIMLFIDVIDLEMTKSLIIHLTKPDPHQVEIYKLYPNPNDGVMQFTYLLNEGETGYLKIYNSQGQKVSSYKLLNGATILNINEKQLMNGAYFYIVYVNNERVFADRFIINK